MGRMLNMAVGDVTDYGLPKPDHKLLEAHPTVSSELLPAARPRRHRGQAEHRPLRRRPDRPLRRRERGGDRPRRLLHRLQDHLPVPAAGGVRVAGQPDAALPEGRLGRAPRPLLHRLHPAAGTDHADRRGPVRMGRRPARREGETALRRRDAGRDLRPRAADEEALRRLQASHDRGGLPPLSAADSARAESGRLRQSEKEAGAPPSLLGCPLRGQQDAADRQAHQPPPLDAAAAAQWERDEGRGGGGGSGGRRPKPPSESSATPPRRLRFRPAHQTSQSEPKTGIFSTTSRKKIGRNPCIGESV